MKAVLFKVFALALVLAPVVSFAQNTGGGVNLSYFANALQQVTGIVTTVLVPLVFALAILVFLWGMFKTFILGGGDPDKQKEGRQLMLWAVVGFFAMVAIWGLVNLLGSIVGVGPTENVPPPPTIPGVTGGNND